MMKVSNRKIVSRLAFASFKANKTRNLMAIIAIALTTVLFTTLFTIGIGMGESFQNQTMRQSGGSAHGALKYITEEQFNAIKDHPLIKEIGYNKFITYADNPEFLKRPVEMRYEDEADTKLRFTAPTTGRIPQQEDEIITDSMTLDLLGIPHLVGEKVTLSYTIKEKIYHKDFVLSGFWESDTASQNVGTAVVSKAFVDTVLADIPLTYKTDYDMTGTISADILFSNSRNIQQKLEQVVTESGYTYRSDDSVGPASSTDIEGNPNWAYLSSSFNLDPSTLVSAAAAAILIIITGYLIIFNIFQISVIKDIKFYGLLKTIGTTSKQIKSMLTKQALLLSVIGIPFGLVIGFVIGKACLPMIVGVSEIGATVAEVSLNPIIFIGAALFALITIFISTRKPGKIAGSVSPVEAVRYSEVTDHIHKTSKKGTDGGKLHKMARSNLSRNKKRTLLVVLSLSLSLVVLNTVFTLSKGMDMDKYLSKFADTDFLIGHANYFNLNMFRSEEDELSESFIHAVKSQPGFEEGGKLYYNLSDSKIHYTGDNRIAYSGHSLLLPEGDDQQLDLYGLEDLPFSRLDIVEGELDLDKLATGKYIIEGLPADDHDNVQWDVDRYKIGEKVQITVDGQMHEYEVIAKAKTDYYTNTNRRGSSFTMYLPADEFTKIVKRPIVMTYAFNVEKNYEQAMDTFLKSYTKDTEPLMNYDSKLTLLDSFKGLQSMLINVGGMLCLIIGLIGILNFINSMLTSLLSRRQEFAIMQSIGMTDKQLRKMVVFEGLYYAAATIIVSLVLGILFSYGVIGGVVGNLWFFSYKFTIIPLLMAYPALLVLSVIIPYVAFRSISKQSVVERLRDTV
ncbi:ABC transporter permease [Paenibacillus sp. FSL P4-0184]|uniref:ABC transporter permease n=1 Tax=Paenibacillus sp. FSL P4-0184 TaxID=2921632 RepID=UPI0030F8E8DC